MNRKIRRQNSGLAPNQAVAERGCRAPAQLTVLGAAAERSSSRSLAEGQPHGRSFAPGGLPVDRPGHPSCDGLGRRLELTGEIGRIASSADQLDHLAANSAGYGGRVLGMAKTPHAKALLVSTDPGQSTVRLDLWGMLFGYVFFGELIGAHNGWRRHHRCSGSSSSCGSTIGAEIRRPVACHLRQSLQSCTILTEHRQHRPWTPSRAGGCGDSQETW